MNLSTKNFLRRIDKSPFFNGNFLVIKNVGTLGKRSRRSEDLLNYNGLMERCILEWPLVYYFCDLIGFLSCTDRWMHLLTVSLYRLWQCNGFTHKHVGPFSISPGLLNVILLWTCRCSMNHNQTITFTFSKQYWMHLMNLHVIEMASIGDH